MYPFMKTNTEIQSDFNRYWLEPLDNALQEISKCDARQAPIREQGYTHLAKAELSQIRVSIRYLQEILGDAEDADEGSLAQCLGYDIKGELNKLSL